MSIQLPDSLTPQLAELAWRHGATNNEKGLFAMEADLFSALHRCIDECGYSWPTTRQVINRMFGRQYTLAELIAVYRHN